MRYRFAAPSDEGAVSEADWGRENVADRVRYGMFFQLVQNRDACGPMGHRALRTRGTQGVLRETLYHAAAFPGGFGTRPYGFAALVPMAVPPKALAEKDANESTHTKLPP